MNQEELDLHMEEHYVHRMGWLRAAVLGANDGIISTTSVIAGVIASGASTHDILVAGVAAAVAGAMSMAAGEYVSVSSQADSEQADLAREQYEFEHNWEHELEELALIYQQRGLSEALAMEVAKQLMEKDPLEAHARDELGITETNSANPIQAALASAASFSIGAILPVILVVLLPLDKMTLAESGFIISAIAVLLLSLLGAMAAKVGGSSMIKGALRVGFWGAAAMAVTAYVGSLFHVPL
ncbi:VIT1/CCC1 transporter family protein [Galenea microaerophila]